MSTASVIITDCKGDTFKKFVERVGLESAVADYEEEKGDVMCQVQQEKLEDLFIHLKKEADKGWSEGSEVQASALEFDSALFPRSTREYLPMRQIRGVLAAKLARKKKSLLPAYATPGYVFGTARSVE